MILGAIDTFLAQSRPKSEAQNIDYDRLHIEHLMPQKWREHWPLDVPAADQRHVGEERDESVHRIGNLTLLTEVLNPSLSNGSWQDKRPEIAKHSKLHLNTEFIENAGWDESMSTQRARRLAASAVSIWPSPEALLTPGHVLPKKEPVPTQSSSGTKPHLDDDGNGQDYYFAFGDDFGWTERTRAWEDGRRFGFVSAGNGRRYSGPLKQLPVGARVWVHIPKTGYVGVGTVTAPAQMARDVTVEVNGQPTRLLDAPLVATAMNFTDDPDMSEWVVLVDWIKALPRENAIWEPGMFANQNTACKLRDQFTIDRLTERLGLDHQMNITDTSRHA